jgi:hypothetical protein
MPALTNEQIREIADQLDCGFRCFCNIETKHFIFIPDLLKHPDIDLSAWEEENHMLESHCDKFKEIESLGSTDSFKIMEDFVQELPDKIVLKSELTNALKDKKPFSHFKFIIDNSENYRQTWFDFKQKWLNKWVQEKFNEMLNQSV